MKFCFETKEFIEKENSPDRLAVIGSDRQLTWKEFQLEVDQLCEKIRAARLDNLSTPVVIYGHKNAQVIVTIYALMKLEIAYIPVDVIYPFERICKVVKASGAQIVFNTTAVELAIPSVTELVVDKTDFSLNNEVEIKPTEEKLVDPIVYVIFTSGSTGEPKGVMISSEAVRSFTRWMCGEDFSFSATDVFVNTAILSFDLSVFELMTFGALGACILLNSQEVTASPNELLDRVKKHKGSVWVSTPSFAFPYSRMKDEARLDSIQTFLFCGEILPQTLASSLHDNFPNARILNTYGPTEATVATTIVTITKEIVEKYTSLPVGVCRDEGRLAIEDKEIIIIGPHVSVGYMNNQKLNEIKFFTSDGERAFRTGDEGYLEDGMLFFHGRNDDLVKLHGFRIELNEITSTLLELEFILQAETIALKRGGVVKKIVSVVSLKEGFSEINKGVIQEGLTVMLPNYMIPSDIKIISKLPLNVNGKVDKKQLQELYLKRG